LILQLSTPYNSLILETNVRSTPCRPKDFLTRQFLSVFTDGTKDSKGNPTISPQLNGLLQSVYSLGAIFGIPFAPWLSQKFGRRWFIMGGSIIMLIGSFKYKVGLYIFARMALGFGVVLCIISASSLIGELGYPKEGATLTSFFNTSYFFGAILASGIAVKTTGMTSDWSWRILSLLQVALPCFKSLVSCEWRHSL
jgi:MFS family permease